MSNKKWTLILMVCASALLLQACARTSTHVGRKSMPVKEKFAQGYVAEGLASWYGYHWKGKRTASGERFDPSKLTAAHRTLPFGAVLRVTNLDNDKSCEVRVNDRGPSKRSKRLIDLSREAARRLGFLGKGVTKVKLEQIN